MESAARRRKEHISLMGLHSCAFFFFKKKKKHASLEVMIPRKQEIRSPKFCSKGSCFPPTTASETSSEGPSQTYVCQKAHSMWCNCHPFLPVTTDFQFYIKHAASLPPLHFLLHTSPGPFTHPFHFKSGSRILKGTGHIWGAPQTATEKLIARHLETQ